MQNDLNRKAMHWCKKRAWKHKNVSHYFTGDGLKEQSRFLCEGCCSEVVSV